MDLPVEDAPLAMELLGSDGDESSEEEEEEEELESEDDIKTRRTSALKQPKKFKKKIKNNLKRDRFRVEAALSRFATRRRRDDSNIPQTQELEGARVTENGHLIGSRADKLAMFEMDYFDVDVFTRAHFSALKEKGVAMFRSDLIALDSECAEEVRGTVHDQYMAFIHACEGITDLEGCMQQLKDMLNVNNSLVFSLKDIASASSKQHTGLSSATSAPNGGVFSPGDQAGNQFSGDTSFKQSLAAVSLQQEAEAMEELLEELEVAIAERRLQDASALFQKALGSVFSISRLSVEAHTREKVSTKGMNAKQKAAEGQAEAESHPRIHEGHLLVRQLQADLEAKRKVMAGLLEQRIQDPTCSDAELRELVVVYSRLMGEPYAVKSMLGAYSAVLQRQQMGLLKPYMSGTGGSSGDGVDYAGAVAQKLFGVLDVALRQFQTVFKDAPQLASIFLAWAKQEVERYLKEHSLRCLGSGLVLPLRSCGSLVKRHALAAHASAGGLLASAQCCAGVLAYGCSMEQRHGICLESHLMRNLWPALESVIQKRLKRVADEIKQVLTEEVVDGRLVVSADDKLPTSGTLLVQEVGSMVGDVAFDVLCDPEMGRCLRQGVTSLFHLYTSTISRTVKKQKKSDASATVCDAQATATLLRALASQHLPQVTAKYSRLLGELVSGPDTEKLIKELEASLKQ